MKRVNKDLFCAYLGNKTYFFSRHGELDLVYSELNMVVNNLAHFYWSIGIGSDTSNELALSSSHFLAVGEVSGARDISSIDGITDDDI